MCMEKTLETPEMQARTDELYERRVRGEQLTEEETNELEAGFEARHRSNQKAIAKIHPGNRFRLMVGLPPLPNPEGWTPPS